MSNFDSRCLTVAYFWPTIWLLNFSEILRYLIIDAYFFHIMGTLWFKIIKDCWYGCLEERQISMSQSLTVCITLSLFYKQRPN